MKPLQLLPFEQSSGLSAMMPMHNRPKLGVRHSLSSMSNVSAFRIAAAFPMYKMKPHVVLEGPPFDVQELLKEIEQAPRD